MDPTTLTGGVSSYLGRIYDSTTPKVNVGGRDLGETREGHVAIMLGGGDSFEHGIAGIPSAVDENFRWRQRVGSRDYEDKVQISNVARARAEQDLTSDRDNKEGRNK